MPDRPAGTSVDVQVGGDDGSQQDGAAGSSGGALGTALRLARSRSVRWGFVVVTVGLGAYAIASHWSGLRDGLASLGFAAVAGAFVCVLAALVALMQVYRVLLAGLGSPLSARAAAQILFVGQLGKYLPGSVWPVLAQMELGAAHAVPRRRSASASVLTMLLSLLTGILVGLVVLPFSAGVTPYWWVFLAAPVILVCLYPKILNRILDRILRLAKRPPLEQPLTGRAVGTALAWGVVIWACYGLQIWLLTARLGAASGSDLLLAIGGFAFAWCAGFLVVLAPAGAGVREVVLIALLGPVVGAVPAGAIALVSRVLLTLADLLSAGLAAFFARRAGLPASRESG